MPIAASCLMRIDFNEQFGMAHACSAVQPSAMQMHNMTPRLPELTNLTIVEDLHGSHALS